MKQSKEGLFSALIIMVISLSIEVSFRRDAPNNHIGSFYIYSAIVFVGIFMKQLAGNYF
jgi:hypothetical protein